MNHLLNLVKLTSSFPRKSILDSPIPVSSLPTYLFPGKEILDSFVPSLRLPFRRQDFSSHGLILVVLTICWKKVRFYGQLTQKNTYSTKRQSTAKPNNVPFSWHISAIFWYSLSWKKKLNWPFFEEEFSCCCLQCSICNARICGSKGFFNMNYDMAFRRDM